MTDRGPDRPRDPFAEAADEEFRRVRDMLPPDARSSRDASPSPAKETFGRGDRPALDEPSSDVPADSTSEPHTPIAGTPPDDPMIYRDASEAQLRSAREAAADERPVAVDAPVVDSADPVAADPTGERFRTGPFANDAGFLQPGPRNAQLCYWANLASIAVFPLLLVSVGFALVNRHRVGPELASHYTYAMRTVFLVILYVLITGAVGDAGGLTLLLVMGWYMWRNLRGLAWVGAGRPVSHPRAWLL